MVVTDTSEKEGLYFSLIRTDRKTDLF